MRALCGYGDPLLDELESQRWAPEPRRRLVALCVDATRVGVFPVVANPMRMVDNYGALWGMFCQPHACPFCAADLRDHAHGPPFKREIGVYDRDADRTVAWLCPDCNREWPR